MALELPGTFRFVDGKAVFVIPHHGGWSMDFSAIDSVESLMTSLNGLRQAALAIESEQTVGPPTDGAQTTAAPVTTEPGPANILQEAELRMAELAKRTETVIKQQCDRVMAHFGASEDAKPE